MEPLRRRPALGFKEVGTKLHQSACPIHAQDEETQNEAAMSVYPNQEDKGQRPQRARPPLLEMFQTNQRDDQECVSQQLRTHPKDRLGYLENQDGRNASRQNVTAAQPGI